MTDQRYKMEDLYIGMTMNINKQKFQIISADQFTLNFLFQKPDLFPLCSPQTHLKSLKDKLGKSLSIEKIKSMLDLILGDRVCYSELYELLQNIGINISYMELYLVFFLCE